MRKKLARPSNSKTVINEHDLTKTMIATLREASFNGEGGGETEDDSIPLEGDELKAEEGKFREQVTPRVQFGEFMIYPNDQNVVWAGQNLSGLKWMMSVREDLKMGGNYDMEDSVLEEIQNIKKYREVWVDEWAIKLANEYKPNNGEQF